MESGAPGLHEFAQRLVAANFGSHLERERKLLEIQRRVVEAGEGLGAIDAGLWACRDEVEGCFDLLFDLLQDDRLYDRGLGAEDPVEKTNADAGFGGNVVDRGRLEAGGCEASARRAEDLPPSDGRVLAAALFADGWFGERQSGSLSAFGAIQ
jgi:hypothetical protein